MKILASTASRITRGSPLFPRRTGQPDQKQSLRLKHGSSATATYSALSWHWRSNGWSNTRHALRVLSVPCSTGEEAYSLAMAPLDANAQTVS
jgi:hypothetical protein